MYTYHVPLYPYHAPVCPYHVPLCPYHTPVYPIIFEVLSLRAAFEPHALFGPLVGLLVLVVGPLVLRLRTFRARAIHAGSLVVKEVACWFLLVASGS